jgi:putative ABC transport system permease protein
MICLVVALITTLVLFVAALGEGLGAGNREYLEKLNGELIIYQENVDLSVAASRIGRSRLSDIRRVPGIEVAGQVGTATASVLLPDGEVLDVSLIGVEPGMPGEPSAVEGQSLGRNRSNEVIIGGHVAERTGLEVGDVLTLKSIQGTEEELYDLTVVGISDGQQYFLQPSIFLPYLTWEKVRPQGDGDPRRGELVSNIVVAKLIDPAEIDEVAARLERDVDGIEVADRKAAYEATPGYSAQQSTLDTQRFFTLFIGILVLGGFFQIQTLQKVGQIGMLKALGTPTGIVALAAIIQIIGINALGVLLGAAGSLLLSLSFPPAVPIVFTGEAVGAAVVSLMLIGPLGGMISVYALLRIEPLMALGLD